jgi:hypothetical protein
MYARSSFEHSPYRSSRPTFPSQPLLEFRFDSQLRIASPPSTPLPVPYQVRTKSFSFYRTSTKSLARLYKKHPGYVPRARFLHAQGPPPQLQLTPIPASLTNRLLLTPLPTSLTKKFPAQRALFNVETVSKMELHTESGPPAARYLHQSRPPNPCHYSTIPALSDH